MNSGSNAKTQRGEGLKKLENSFMILFRICSKKRLQKFAIPREPWSAPDWREARLQGLIWHYMEMISEEQQRKIRRSLALASLLTTIVLRKQRHKAFLLSE